MKFVKDATYFVASISHDHMVIALNKHGIAQISEPTTRNQVTQKLGFETPLVYVGRTKELQGPTFRLPDGTMVRGHENNFNLDSEYNKDKMRNRGDENAANTKPEKLGGSVKALFASLQARDPKMAAAIARELEKASAQKIADLVIDQVIAEQEAAPAPEATEEPLSEESIEAEIVAESLAEEAGDGSEELGDDLDEDSEELEGAQVA